jgi:hypothetical protein
MHKSATKCNETIDKWCKNKHGASKIIDTLETYQPPGSVRVPKMPLSLFVFVWKIEGQSRKWGFLNRDRHCRRPIHLLSRSASPIRRCHLLELRYGDSMAGAWEREEALFHVLSRLHYTPRARLIPCRRGPTPRPFRANSPAVWAWHQRWRPLTYGHLFLNSVVYLTMVSPILLDGCIWNINFLCAMRKCAAIFDVSNLLQTLCSELFLSI